MFKRKSGVLLLAACLVVSSLSGCGPEDDAEASAAGQETGNGQEGISAGSLDDRDSGGQSQEQAEQGTDTAEQGRDTEGQGAAEAEDAVQHPTAQEIMDDIVAGWNLGNALDSHTRENEGLASETAWGNPATTKEMIDMVRDTGVNLIRVPVTWYNHMDPGSYEIDREWMDRVEEVVNYVLDNDMYCIINVHHDTGEKGWLRASRTGLEENSRKLAAIWEQICGRFGGYGEKLLFEGFNELLDDRNTWNNPGKEAVEVTNELNQLFVDTVRASGGNNADRCLIVSTYCAGGNREATDGFVMPADTADGKLIVEAHIYQPYGFVSGTSGTAVTWASGKSALDSCLSNMRTSFIEKGIPVLVGEFGCVSSRSAPERQTWLQYYMDTCYNYGIKCVWWDNGAEWKIVDRKTMKIAEPELFEIMVTEATDSNARITFGCGASGPDGSYAVRIENLTLIRLQ